jgi:lysozyme
VTIYDWLRLDEGKRATAYHDPVSGTLTIGYGHNCAVPISDAAQEQILRDDVSTAYTQCMTLPWFAGLNDARAAVIVMMVFNLGLGAVLKFPKMIAAVQAKDWELARSEMLDSVWSTQVGERATRLATQMRTGVWPSTP